MSWASELFKDRLASDIQNGNREPISCPMCGARRACPGIVEGYCDDCGWKLYKFSDRNPTKATTEAFLVVRVAALAKRLSAGKPGVKCEHFRLTAHGYPTLYQCGNWATTHVGGHPCCSSHARRTKGYIWIDDGHEPVSPLTSVLVSIGRSSERFFAAINDAARTLSEERL